MKTYRILCLGSARVFPTLALAYDWLSAELGKVTKGQATKACGDFLEDE